MVKLGTVLEDVPLKENSSFRVLQNKYLNNFYYWHFHPEYELTFITANKGQRQIGEHKAEFSNGDLALIGPYVPHLNFDFGQKKTNYKITVLHIDEHFILPAVNRTKELRNVKQLLNDSKKGIVFKEDLKKLGPRIQMLSELKGFPLFLEVLSVLEKLSGRENYTLLHERDYENRFHQKEHERLQNVIHYIENNYQRSISLSEVAKVSNYSESAFCRYFKKWTKISFTAFVNNYRVEQAKILLSHNTSVSQVAFDVGFESLSYFNRVFKKITGMNPLTFKKQLG